jgi:N-methylhydantoinase B
LPDIYLCKPIFLKADVNASLTEPVAFVVCIAHHTDIGGKTPGGNGCDATELYQEGLCIPLLKLYDAGVANQTIFDIIARNVRIPRQVLGDLRAELACLHVGEQGVRALFEKYGGGNFIPEHHTNSPDESVNYFAELLDYAERLARAEISGLPDGVYAFTDYLDDDGIDPDSIPITVTVTVDNDQLTADFTGTAPQVKGGINCPLSFTQSATYACVRCLMNRDVPNNGGYFRPITVIAPEGTIVNPLPPGPVAARGLTGFRIANTVFGALAQAAPDSVPACEIGGDTGVSIGGYERVERDGKTEMRGFVFLEFLYGSWGGRPNQDGIDGVASSVVNFSNNPVEVLEAELPLRIETYNYLPDTGGAGTHRGGLSLVRDFRLLAEEATLQVRADRTKYLPYGLHGGAPGMPSQNILNPDGEERELPPKPTLTIQRGDLFRHIAAGAGGWGNPFERDPQMVREDVLEEKVTLQSARDAYGVVIDPETLQVDEAATRRMREDN